LNLKRVPNPRAKKVIVLQIKTGFHGVFWPADYQYKMSTPELAGL
jgi:hypothetical protein